MRQQEHGLYGKVAARAMADALYERLIDDCWDEIKKVFNRPDIREAEVKIMRALAESFAPTSNGHARGIRNKTRRKK